MVINPHLGMNNFINFMIQCPDLQTPNGTPSSMDACVTYMSHMYNIRYSKKDWEDIIYPLYVERFNLSKPNAVI